jgi:hypothetical protein
MQRGYVRTAVPALSPCVLFRGRSIYPTKLSDRAPYSERAQLYLGVRYSAEGGEGGSCDLGTLGGLQCLLIQATYHCRTVVNSVRLRPHLLLY